MRLKNKIALTLGVVLVSVASNAQKTAFKKDEFKQWAQTPPMGWNSWDCYGSTVEEHEVKANADYMVKNLKKSGWEYIVVDIRWFVENDKAGGYNQKDPRYVMDKYGRYLPALNRFPSAKDGQGFKPLADYIHSKGLKFGIHIMRGIPKKAVEEKLPIKGVNGITADQIYTTELQCEWLKDNYTILADKPGAQEYYDSLFELYAQWGVDFIKIDDLSDMEAHKMTHFYQNELKCIYQCFGMENYVLTHGDGIHICVSTASDAHPGRKNHYKFDPEEIFLYTLSRIATGLPSTTIIDMYFGGTYSRWGYGYRFMLDYIDQRYASILGHQGLLRFTDKFPDFHRCIEHYCQRDHIQYDANNNPEIVPGLNHLPPEYNIFGFIDDTIDQICTPYSGPAGDFIGAPHKAQYMTAKRAVYTGC